MHLEDILLLLREGDPPFLTSRLVGLVMWDNKYGDKNMYFNGVSLGIHQREHSSGANGGGAGGSATAMVPAGSSYSKAPSRS